MCGLLGVLRGGRRQHDQLLREAVRGVLGQGRAAAGKHPREHAAVVPAQVEHHGQPARAIRELRQAQHHQRGGSVY